MAPTYDYECDRGHSFEAIQSIHDAPFQTCPRDAGRNANPESTEAGCCGAKLRRLISPAAFHLKGSGWFKDGYGAGKKNG